MPGVLASLAAGVAIVVVIAVFSQMTGVSRTSGPPTVTTVVSFPDSPPDTPYPTTTTTTTTEPLTVDSAKAELDRLVAEDRPDVEALVGQWIPQLSAKRPGLVVNGITFDYLEILRDHTALQARHPGALLLYSGEYSSFKHGDFWITVMPLSHPTGEAANAWCDIQSIGPDDCYAKLISHTQGYRESTRYR
jgi:hypothetical protein